MPPSCESSLFSLFVSLNVCPWQPFSCCILCILFLNFHLFVCCYSAMILRYVFLLLWILWCTYLIFIHEIYICTISIYILGEFVYIGTNKKITHKMSVFALWLSLSSNWSEGAWWATYDILWVQLQVKVFPQILFVHLEEKKKILGKHGGSCEYSPAILLRICCFAVKKTL
jgi:hypothetical protein